MRPPTPESAKKRAWFAFAAYIRARDKYCVTCGNPTTEAGHYRPNSDKKNKQLGGNELWYHEINVNGQCGICNRWKSGALDKYSLYLEKKYGHEVLQILNNHYLTPKKFTIEELLKIEKKYQDKLSKLK